MLYEWWAMICTSSLDALVRIHCDYDNDLWTFTWQRVNSALEWATPQRLLLFEQRNVQGISILASDLWASALLRISAVIITSALTEPPTVDDVLSSILNDNVFLSYGGTITPPYYEMVHYGDMVPIIKSNYTERNVVIDTINNHNNIGSDRSRNEYSSRRHKFFTNEGQTKRKPPTKSKKVLLLLFKFTLKLLYISA